MMPVFELGGLRGPFDVFYRRTGKSFRVVGTSHPSSTTDSNLLRVYLRFWTVHVMSKNARV
jgi:hypothetical protein